MRAICCLALVASLLALGCNSGGSSSGETASTPPPVTPAEGADASTVVAEKTARVIECQQGNVIACEKAGLHEAGCDHGDADACVRAAETPGAESARWMARACRRGKVSACPDVPAAQMTMTSPASGPLVTRIEEIYRASIGDCFAELEASGRVDLTLSIGPDGRVARVESNSKNRKLARCAEARAGSWSTHGLELAATSLVLTFEVAPPPAVASSSDDDDAIREVISSKALMAVLAGGDEHGRYSRLDDLSDQGASLDQAIQDIKKSGNGASGKVDSRIGSRTARGGGVGGPATKATDVARSRVKMGSADVGDSSLDPTHLLRRIRSRYLRGIKRCHEQLLERDKTAGGRIALTFKIGPTGRVSSASARGFSPDVDQCITAQMKKWRFAIPRDSSGSPTTATFSMPIVLKAG